LPKNVASNKKVGSRPLAPATCLEAPQYNFYAAKTQEQPEGRFRLYNSCFLPPAGVGNLHPKNGIGDARRAVYILGYVPAASPGRFREPAAWSITAVILLALLYRVLAGAVEIAGAHLDPVAAGKLFPAEWLPT
jgi:hypothetical protein